MKRSIWRRIKDWFNSKFIIVDNLLDTTGTNYVDHETLDVRQFLDKFGHITNNHPVHLTKRKLIERHECMLEELNEFKDGVDFQDLGAMADALIDLVYFAKGTAIMLGLPWETLWADVQSANMDKVPGVGKRGHTVDVVKPHGWIPPQTDSILVAYGYVRRRWVCPGTNVIDEERCIDD